MQLQREEATKKLEIQAEINRIQDAEKLAAKKAEQDMQKVIDAIHEASLARKDKDNAQEIAHKKEIAAIEAAKQKAYADTVTQIVGAISEDLVAAMTTKSNNDMTVAIAQAIAPYALAGDDESVADVVNKLLRGTALEQLVDDVNINV